MQCCKEDTPGSMKSLFFFLQT